jgi:hypothetical protein
MLSLLISDDRSYRLERIFFRIYRLFRKSSISPAITTLIRGYLWNVHEITLTFFDRLTRCAQTNLAQKVKVIS